MCKLTKSAAEENDGGLESCGAKQLDRRLLLVDHGTFHMRVADLLAEFQDIFDATMIKDLLKVDKRSKELISTQWSFSLGGCVNHSS